MTKGYWKTQLETCKHKYWVSHYMLKIAFKLIWRAVVHDLSKFSNVEATGFAKKITLLPGMTYGSPEYMKMLTEMPHLQHHYKCNSHHPEHYSDGFREMSGLDRIEMLCDWKSATRRHKDGDVWKSILINQGRFGYNDTDREWMSKLMWEIE